MKLGKLTIHNIASIEDAEIDFGSGPLSESEVFLIAGKTGAGKSTILDAICLALYADTPRLANTSMQGESKDTDKDIKINDPRQLMRRNTGEAFARLSFTGNNRIRYEATWSAARARCKPTGNLQAKKWQLKNLEDGHTLTKDKEITDEIQRAVGLDFRQFCRTTLLAQGEFTRFLNSTDKDKAEILEKITGVDIYSKIGAQIYATTEEKRLSMNEALRKVEDTKILSDVETAKLNSESAEIDRRLTSLTELRADYDKKRNWILTDAGLAVKISTASVELEAARRLTLDENYKAEETLIRQWNGSIEPRAWLNQRDSALRDSGNLRKSLAEAHGEFAAVRRGQLQIAGISDALHKSIDELSASIEAEKEKASIYADAQKITEWILTAIDAKKKIETEKANLKKENDLLTGCLNKKKQSADETLAKAKADADACLAKLKKRQKLLADARLPELRKEKERLQRSVGDGEIALERLATLRKEAGRHSRMKQELTSRRIAIADLQRKLDEILPQAAEAEKETETCRRMFEAQKETVDSWAKAMRARLNKGDKCPVCGQTVRAVLPSEEDLETLVRSCAEAYEKARKRHAALVLKQTQTAADIRSQTLSLVRERKAIDADTSLADAEKSAAEACAKCGVAGIADNPHEAIAEFLSAAKKALAVTIGKAAEAERLEMEATAERTNAEKLANIAERANEESLRANMEIAECKARIATSKALIKSREEEVDAAEKMTAQLLGATKWDTDRHADPNAFLRQLDRATREYEKRRQSLTACLQNLRETETLARDVAETADAITAMMPEWRETEAGEAEVPKNLRAAANLLRSRVHSAIDRIKTANSAADDADARLKVWTAHHNEFSEPLLSELDRKGATEISAAARRHADTDKELANRQTLLAEYTMQRAEHAKERPKLTENDTPDNIAAAIADADRLIKEESQRKGAIEQMLREDISNRERLKEKLTDANGKRREFERWDRLNQLIGTKQGDRFRKVAQSYVLANLIRTANGYMQTLSDRYRLKVAPGNFVILLEDAWQGYATRAASTISGGECFLVSLALALALSDIGQTLQVDTLFIDEGFGTLSGEPLQHAVATLHTLRKKGGRHVGIISHIEELKDRIPMQIRVVQEGKDPKSVIEISRG